MLWSSSQIAARLGQVRQVQVLPSPVHRLILSLSQTMTLLARIMAGLEVGEIMLAVDGEVALDLATEKGQVEAPDHRRVVNKVALPD